MSESSKEACVAVNKRAKLAHVNGMFSIALALTTTYLIRHLLVVYI